MLRQALRVNGSSVYVYKERSDCSFNVVVDFDVDDLFFIVFESQLWAVECLGKGASLLIFDGLELVKIE